MAPVLARSLSRLPKAAIIDLALEWLQDSRTATPYLRNNRTGFEADEEDYLHDPAKSISELRQYYQSLRRDATRVTKRDVIDRIVDGDWRRGISLHQHATIDFANLEQNDNALRWSALKLVPLEVGQKLRHHGDSSQPAKKKRKVSHDRNPAIYPQVKPEAFLSALKAEISPLVKAHYHLQRMPPPHDLTILRVCISPASAFAPQRAKVPRTPKHATDNGRIMYIALPDSCPYVYISISGATGASHIRSKGSGSAAGDAKEEVMAKVNMAAMKKLVLEAIPKAFSRPQQRWALDSTKLVAKSLKTMCELRGNQKRGTGGGVYSVFADGEGQANQSPVDIQMLDESAGNKDDHQSRVEQRFGDMQGRHYAALDRVSVKLTNILPAAEAAENDESTLSAAEETEAGEDIMLTFSGSDVFKGLKKLAEMDSSYIDLDKMPAWMTGELGLSTITA